MVQQMSCIHYANGNGITTGYYITADWGITKSCHITTTYHVIHSLEITTRVLSIATASQMALCHCWNQKVLEDSMSSISGRFCYTHI